MSGRFWMRVAARMPNRALYWMVVEARVRWIVTLDESVATLINQGRSTFT